MSGFRIGRKFAQHTYPTADKTSGIIGNRVQQTSDSGTVVAAGAAITPDASLTVKSTDGTARVRVNATTSFTFDTETGPATVAAQLYVSKNAGPLSAIWTWARATDGQESIASVFEYDTAAVHGDVLHFHWQTTLGDAPITLGDATFAGTLAAALLIEELPKPT